MRLNRFVAAASGLSRRAADAAIAAGRVQLAGQPASLGQIVEANASVELDGQPLQLPATHHYILLHKPAGYVTSRRRQGSDPTIYELLPADFAALRPVGRLDRDSSGLLLLSDDGDFIQRHTHPSFGKDKQYEIDLDRPLAPADRRQLEAGVDLHISMQVGNNSAIKHGVAAGLGIALISRVALDMELETNRLTILDVEGFPIMRQWRLVHLKDKYLSPTARAFKAFVLENADRRLRRRKPEEPEEAVE